MGVCRGGGQLQRPVVQLVQWSVSCCSHRQAQAMTARMMAEAAPIMVTAGHHQRHERGGGHEGGLCGEARGRAPEPQWPGHRAVPGCGPASFDGCFA